MSLMRMQFLCHKTHLPRLNLAAAAFLMVVRRKRPRQERCRSFPGYVLKRILVNGRRSLALPCLYLPCLASPRLASPRLASPRLASTCLALPCLALPCLALPCLALPCLALPLPLRGGNPPTPLWGAGGPLLPFGGREGGPSPWEGSVAARHVWLA